MSCLHSNLSNDDIVSALRPGLKTGMDFRGQAPGVQKVHSIIQWMNLYPVDTGVENDIRNGARIWRTGYTDPHQEFPGVTHPPPPPTTPLMCYNLFISLIICISTR